MQNHKSILPLYLPDLSKPIEIFPASRVENLYTLQAHIETYHNRMGEYPLAVGVSYKAYNTIREDIFSAGVQEGGNDTTGRFYWDGIAIIGVQL